MPEERVPDFRVRYKFRSAEEGGRRTGPPKQGYRSDFMYEGQRPEEGIFMIWPGFEDANGALLEELAQVPPEGTAQMFIIQDEFRSYHRERVSKGARGFMMEGPMIVADVEIIEVIGLEHE